jgi:hypothetical protein
MLNISPQLLPHFKGFCSSPSVIMLFEYKKTLQKKNKKYKKKHN